VAALKFCVICKKEIKAKDNYCRLTDYIKGVFFSEGFYHTLCYNNQIRGMNPAQVKMKRLALGVLGKASSLLNQTRGKATEYHIQ